jgi:RNA polymerase sigma-70 factor (ECF subfamily)
VKIKKTKYSEQELIEKLKMKDKAAFSVLYDSYSSALFGVILKIVRTDPPAEDVLQEAFLKIWKKIEAYDVDKGTIFTWMLNVCRNTGIDLIRSESYKRSATVFDLETNTHLADREKSENFKAEHVGVSEIVNKLKPEHKEIIDLIYFGGYTQSEVAEHLQMPLGTVKTRVKIAMNHLRQTFTD